MRNRFLTKSFTDLINGSSSDEIKVILSDLFQSLFINTELLTMERHAVILEAIAIEVRRELDQLKPRDGDQLGDLAAETGTIILESFLEAIQEAIDRTNTQEKES